MKKPLFIGLMAMLLAIASSTNVFAAKAQKPPDIAGMVSAMGIQVNPAPENITEGGDSFNPPYFPYVHTVF